MAHGDSGDLVSRPVGSVHERHHQHQLVRTLRGEVTEELPHLGRVGQGEGDQSAVDHRHGMGVVLERRCHAEVPAPASQRPVQVGILLGVGRADLTVGVHELHGTDVVDGHPVLAHQPAKPATERQAGDAGCRHDTAGRRQAVSRGSPVVLVPAQPSLGPHAPSGRVDMNALHGLGVDHEATVGHSAPRHVVATAADRDLQVVLSRELHGIRDVGGVLAPDDDGRALVDHAVVDLTHRVVGGIDRSEGLTRDRRPQLVNRLLRNRTARHCTPPGSRALRSVSHDTSHINIAHRSPASASAGLAARVQRAVDDNRPHPQLMRPPGS